MENRTNVYPFLAGGGKMGELTRNFDWAKTSVGTPDTWPQSLRTTVSNILRSKFPMFLWWDTEMIQFYNDAYRPSLGNEGKHPSALGAKGRETWPEIWDMVSPLMEQVEVTGEATWRENQLVPIYRNGMLEDVYWTFSYSSVLDDDGNHRGILVTCMETTENVMWQNKIEKSQQELLQLFEESPVAVATIGKEEDLIFQYANRFYGVLVGRSPDQIVGQPLLKALPELADQGFDTLLHEVIRTGKPFLANEVSVDIFRNNNIETIFVNLAYQPRIQGDGLVAGVLVVATDVSEQVAARKTLELSEAKFRLMAESTPVLISVSDETGNSEYYNRAWTNLTGKSADALLQIGWSNILLEEDRAHYDDIYLYALAGTVAFNGEFRVLNASGEVRWLLADGVPRFDNDGKFVGYITACTDITENKINQRQLETALQQVRLSKEAAELGTFDINVKNGTMHWDARCRTLFGISHNQTVSYEKDFVKGLHDSDRNRVLKVIDRAFDKAASNGDYDIEYRTVGSNDGEVRWLRAKGKVYFDNYDKPTRFIGSVLDITNNISAIQKIESLVEKRTKELGEANLALQKANRELQRSNAHLEEFAYAASHDLKEPVRKIHVFTTQLKEQLSAQLSEGQAKTFSRIKNATERMVSLIDDLLIYSHVTHRPHEMEDVDLNQKVQRVLEDLEVDIEEKGAKIHTDSLPVVKGYTRQLQQLLQNLISNAIKYSREDVVPDISIVGSSVIENGQRYQVISVQDNGIGFDEIYADKIFQMFTRLHNKEEYGGTGVGLSIVKKIVENHDGFVRVKSKPLQGSIFTVFLPE
ncbi:MAG: PAS domain S-box protein [Chitinophagaceae bacterium]|nr:MAG: PAS domain S-box protein [Chitinophagaceae bacterium]